MSPTDRGRPRLLDLFCGAGGCSVGYHRAGFDVTGVDIEPHKDYPFPMIVGDAMTVLDCPAVLKAFDVIHASPPCQAYATVTSWRGDQDNHPDLLPAVRSALTAWGDTWGGQWVIENVPEAPIRRDYLLCGSMFGLRVRRHRAFESSEGAMNALLHPCDHRNLLPFEHKREREYADAMGCTWMGAKEARESIPPAYTQFIGEQLIQQLQEMAS